VSGRESEWEREGDIYRKIMREREIYNKIEIIREK
jgi:hypothetical protein